MFCIDCGAGNPDTALYCFRCGVRLFQGDGAASSPADTATGPPAPSDDGSNASSAAGVLIPAEPTGGLVVRQPSAVVPAEGGSPALPGFAARLNRFTPLNDPAVLVYLFTTLVAVLAVIVVIALLGRIDVTNKILSNDYVSTSDVTDSDDFVAISVTVFLLALLAAWIAFIWWLYRANANLGSLGALEPSFGAGWAIGAWFIPVVNLWVPLLLGLQAWKAADPRLPPGPNLRWKDLGGPAVAFAWWFGFAAAAVLGWTASAVSDAHGGTAEDIRDAAFWLIAWAITLAVSAGMGARFVASTTRRQRERATYLSGVPPAVWAEAETWAALSDERGTRRSGTGW